MGTAPTHQQENRGLDDKQINLGVVQPGEKPSVFGDALRRLGNRARFMHGDLGRYWYSSASLNRVAADRAEQVEEALVLVEIDKLLTMSTGSVTRPLRCRAGSARKFRGSFSVSRIPMTAAPVPGR